jgi:uncharacterized phage infection (PIP) family protein YhgE
LQNPNQINGDNVQNLRCETSRTCWKKKRVHLKDKINELETNNKHKNIRDLYKGTNEFKKGYKPRINIIKDENDNLSVYADDVNLLGDSINTMKENTDTLLQASRDICLEINAEKAKYMIMSCHPNSGQNQNIKIGNEWFENVAKFKYLGMTLTNKNDIHDEIKE